MQRTRGILYITTLCLLVLGCNDTPLPGGKDAGGDQMLGSPDATQDAVAVDGVADATGEGVDQSLDGALDAIPDALVELGPDQAPDLSPDALVDALIVDLVDAAPASPCAVGHTLKYSYATNMHVCEGTTAVKACEAQSFCNGSAGWHLCTASEYRARGGASTSPPAGAGSAWIATCIRDQGTVIAPSDATCPLCTGGSAPAETVQWTASGMANGTSTAANIAVWSFSSQLRLGVNSPDAFARWSWVAGSVSADRALCCSTP